MLSKNRRRKKAENFSKSFFLSKIAIMSKLREKPSVLKREHRALQKIKLLTFLYVCGYFFFPGSGLRIRMRILIHNTERSYNYDFRNCEFSYSGKIFTKYISSYSRGPKKRGIMHLRKRGGGLGGNPFRLPIQSSDVLSWSGLLYMYPTVTGVKN